MTIETEIETTTALETDVAAPTTNDESDPVQLSKVVKIDI